MANRMNKNKQQNKGGSSTSSKSSEEGGYVPKNIFTDGLSQDSSKSIGSSGRTVQTSNLWHSKMNALDESTSTAVTAGLDLSSSLRNLEDSNRSGQASSSVPSIGHWVSSSMHNATTTSPTKDNLQVPAVATPASAHEGNPSVNIRNRMGWANMPSTTTAAGGGNHISPTPPHNAPTLSLGIADMSLQSPSAPTPSSSQSQDGRLALAALYQSSRRSRTNTPRATSEGSAMPPPPAQNAAIAFPPPPPLFSASPHPSTSTRSDHNANSNNNPLSDSLCYSPTSSHRTSFAGSLLPSQLGDNDEVVHKVSSLQSSANNESCNTWNTSMSSLMNSSFMNTSFNNSRGGYRASGSTAARSSAGSQSRGGHEEATTSLNKSSVGAATRGGHSSSGGSHSRGTHSSSTSERSRRSRQAKGARLNQLNLTDYVIEDRTPPDSREPSNASNELEDAKAHPSSAALPTVPNLPQQEGEPSESPPPSVNVDILASSLPRKLLERQSSLPQSPISKEQLGRHQRDASNPSPLLAANTRDSICTTTEHLLGLKRDSICSAGGDDDNVNERTASNSSSEQEDADNRNSDGGNVSGSSSKDRPKKKYKKRLSFDPSLREPQPPGPPEYDQYLTPQTHKSTVSSASFDIIAYPDSRVSSIYDASPMPLHRPPFSADNDDDMSTGGCDGSVDIEAMCEAAYEANAERDHELGMMRLIQNQAEQDRGIGMRVEENLLLPRDDESPLPYHPQDEERRVMQQYEQGGGRSNTGKDDEARRDEKEQRILRRKIQRLLLIRHCSTCKVPHLPPPPFASSSGNDAVPLFQGDKPTTTKPPPAQRPSGVITTCPVTSHCAEGKALCTHIRTCRDPNCNYKKCLTSRDVLGHYKSCKDDRCEICGPVRSLDRRQRRRTYRSDDSSIETIDDESWLIAHMME